LEKEQRRYAFDNSGLAKVDSIFDPHRPYQPFLLKREKFFSSIASCTPDVPHGEDESPPAIITLHEPFKIFGGAIIETGPSLLLDAPGPK
jgi:hypothetical protein